MEKRIGAILILVKEKEHISQLNDVLSRHGSIIIGRQGIPVREKGISVISIVVEGTTDEISSLSGQVGRIEGVSSKAILAKD